MPFHIAAETIGGIPWKQPTKGPGTQHDVKKKIQWAKKKTHHGIKNQINRHY